MFNSGYSVLDFRSSSVLHYCICQSLNTQTWLLSISYHDHKNDFQEWEGHCCYQKYKSHVRLPQLHKNALNLPQQKCVHSHSMGISSLNCSDMLSCNHQIVYLEVSKYQSRFSLFKGDLYIPRWINLQSSHEHLNVSGSVRQNS